MFSALITAMVGAFLLTRAGLLDATRLYVPETYLAPQLIGGALFGIGFVVAGLCPGTSCVAAASGRVDGVAVMLGMFGGVVAGGFAKPLLGGLYDASARGAATLPGLLGWSTGTMVCAIVLVALLAFRGAAFLEETQG